MTIRRWLAVATRPDVVRRSIGVALVVGTILVLINHVDKLIALDIARSDILKIVLTYLVPYGVSTYASVITAVHDHRPSTSR